MHADAPLVAGPPPSGVRRCSVRSGRSATERDGYPRNAVYRLRRLVGDEDAEPVDDAG
jgi:hypothetical protein